MLTSLKHSGLSCQGIKHGKEINRHFTLKFMLN
jgi:hypothetical protein